MKATTILEALRICEIYVEGSRRYFYDCQYNYLIRRLVTRRMRQRETFRAFMKMVAAKYDAGDIKTK